MLHARPDTNHPPHHGTAGRNATCWGLLGLLFGGACAEPLPESPRLSITLDHGWTSRPWSAAARPAVPGTSVRSSVSVVVPDSLPADTHAALELNGLWWAASVSVDGHPAVKATGGQGSVWLDLGPLPPGPHKLSLAVSPPPSGLSDFALGGGLGPRESRRVATLTQPPRLHLHPPVWVSGATLRLQRGQASGWASIDGLDTDGTATAHFSVVRDGKVVADLGEAPVVGGVATTPPRPYTGPTWEWGAPELVHLVVDLLDADGTPLDRHTVRTGAREVSLSRDGLAVNDVQGAVFAVRVVHGDDQPDLLTTLSALSPGGANAVELHGDVLDPTLLRLADELGVPVVVLPRCVGRLGKPKGAASELTAMLEALDNAVLQDALAHPSVVAWLMEGDRQLLHPGAHQTSELSPWTTRLAADPQDRPVVGEDLPGTVLRVADLSQGRFDCPGGCTGRWAVEATVRVQPLPDYWLRFAGIWQQFLETGVPGGTLPTPPAGEEALWTGAFGPVARAVDAPAWTLSHRRRGPSRVVVSGAKPQGLYWVEVPGLAAVGATATAAGEVAIDVWHRGDVRVRGPGLDTEVFVWPLRWEGVKLYGRTAVVGAHP